MNHIDAPRKRKVILCIDDDSDTCEMLAVLLTRVGYEVSYAMNVADGLALARQGGFDLILIDWYLPDGTGVELCKLIREFDTVTPIIFYTGEARDHELQQSINAGAQSYLIKPVDSDMLLVKIAELTGGTGSVN